MVCRWDCVIRLLPPQTHLHRIYMKMFACGTCEFCENQIKIPQKVRFYILLNLLCDRGFCILIPEISDATVQLNTPDDPSSESVNE